VNLSDDTHSPGSLQFLKLGGSLITDKNRPQTPRREVLARLSAEIASALARTPGRRLVLGHGSGSFGHGAGKKHGTRQGVFTPQGWLGFAEVWRDAGALNRIVMDSLHAAGLPAISFPPSASVTSQDGKVAAWDLTPIRSALQSGLLPVVFGDVVFDTVRGGTILSTEDLFDHLARELQPGRLLLAGIEAGVWADFPTCSELVPQINPANLDQVAQALGGSLATDVTGGMASKVREMLQLVQAMPALEVLIFSGEKPGLVQSALEGEPVGTAIRSGRI
jgi:isopentenyl phosphate kinase